MRVLILAVMILGIVACQEEKKEEITPAKPVKSFTLKKELSTEKMDFIGKIKANLKANLSRESCRFMTYR